MTIKERVLVALKNHKNCTSYGIANLLNVRRFSVLRALSELTTEGVVRVQRGRTVDGYPEPRWRSCKLAKEMFTQIEIFQLKRFVALQN